MAGRPKNTFSDEEVAKIEQLAFEGCQAGTISNITGIALMTLKRHFGKNMTRKRCERKAWLRQCQNKQAEQSADMCKFLGKNELDQKDKKEISDGRENKVKDLTPEQIKFYKEVAAEVLARQRREKIKERNVQRQG